MFEYKAVVRSVHDGDSLRCDVDLGFGVWISDMALRLYGVDAPELGSPEGRAARDWLRERLPVGKIVVVRTFKDATEKYGRMLAQVWERGPEYAESALNDQLLGAGHARPYFGGAR